MMRTFHPRFFRWEFVVAVGLASCLRTESPPRVAPSGRLNLSEVVAGPRGKAPFAVVAAGPRGVVTSAGDPGITLVFNRAMRRLDTPEYEKLPQLKVGTSDGRPVPGRFRWVGTHGVIFEPEQLLAGATRFVVTVPKGVVAVDGSSLGQDYTLEFATARPELSSSYPREGTRTLRPNESIFLKFSQPIDPAELAKRIKLSAVVPGQKLPQALAVTVKSGAPHWTAAPAPVAPQSGAATAPSAAPSAAPPKEPDFEATREVARAVADPTGLWLQVTPTQPLPSDTALSLQIPKGLRGLSGPLPTEEPMAVALRTFGPLRLEDLRCARQNLGRCQAHRDFTAIFSNPVHPDEFRRFLKVKGPARPARPVSGAEEAPPHASDSQPLALDPGYGDAFDITVQAGLPDIFGQKLAKDVTVQVQVEEPYVTPAKRPVAARPAAPCKACTPPPPPPPASVPQRPALQYGLELGIRGYVLEALGGARGAEGPAKHQIPVGAVNVPTYGLHTAAIPELSTVRWLGMDRGGSGEPRGSYPFAWISPAVPKNIRAVRQIDVDTLLGGLGHRGSAFIALTALGQGDATTQSLVSVTDLGLSTRFSQLGSLVWVTHLATGVPAPGAEVVVYDAEGKIRCQGQTDSQGLASFSPEQLRPIDAKGNVDKSLLLVARMGEDWTYQRVEPTHSASGDESVDYEQKAVWAGLVFTDRGVYRPGETMKASGYFRRTAEKGFSVVPGAELQYSVRDAQGELVADGRGKLDAFGALAVDVGLSKSAALGQATLEVRLGRKDDGDFSVPFQILAYKPAEFKVAVDPSRMDVIHKEKVGFTVHSEYLFGAPVGGGKVEEYVTRTETYFRPPNTAGYVIDDSAFRQDLRWTTERGTAYSQKTETLGQDGRLAASVLLDAPQQSQPEQLVFEAEVQDISAQSQSGRASVLVHPAAFYLGLKAPKKSFFAIGGDFPAEVVAVDPKGNPVEGMPIEVVLWRRTWSSVVEDRAADTLHYQTHVRDEKVGSCALSSRRGGTSCGLRLTQPGFYIARATSKDALGNPVYASLGAYAVNDRADESAAPVGWTEPDRRGLRLEADQKKYEPGDTAKILVKNPFSEATALVTVERAGVMDRKVVTLKGPMPLVEIPVKEEYFPNAFVSVHLLRGRVAAMPEPGKADLGAPEFRIGYTSLRVDPESRRLKVEVTPARKEYQPGEMVEARVSLKRSNGAPASGSVTFYAVDEGVLMLTGYQTPDPIPAFSGLRSLGVFATESRENLAKILLLQDGERVPTLGFEMARSGGADKGDEVGGAGDAGRLRGDFRTTAFFEAGHKVGSDGQSTFRFKLPDNLTSYRLMAVAAGSEDRFGSGEGSITTQRKLMARPALPRSLRVGDTVEAAVVVTSKDLARSAVDVSLVAQGASPVGPTQRRIDLPKNGQIEVRFPVKITAPGAASFEFKAQAGAAVDRVKLSRKIEDPIHWLTAASFGSTSGAAAVSLGDLAGVRRDKGELTITASSSALVGLKGVFQDLEDYPYGCTEQLASRVLPVLAAPKLAEQVGVSVPAGQASWIDEALGQILKRQHGDGSFGFWEEDSTSRPWLTAYALWTLERASQSGYFVPKQGRDNASAHLLGRLDSMIAEVSRQQSETEEKSEGDAEGDGDSEQATEEASGADPFSARTLGPGEKRRLAFAQACFVADVLASLGQLDEGRVRKLSAARAGTAVSSRAQLLHAMARLRMPRPEIEQLLAEVLSEVAVGPGEARVEKFDEALSNLFESPVRSTAWVLRAVLAANPKHPLASKLARGLVSYRTRGAYRNTQEDAWALVALEEYRQSQEAVAPNFGATLFLGDSVLEEMSFRGLPIHSETVKLPISELLASGASTVSAKVSGKGTLHYAVEMKVAKEGGSTLALDEGLGVDKRVRALDPSALEKASQIIPKSSEIQAKMGQLVLVDLLLESAEYREQVVLEDPLPAGLEPVEFGFATTAQALSSAETATPSVQGKPLPPASRYGAVASLPGVHREMHDDRVILFIPQIDAGIYHFRYLARATTAGKFVVPPSQARCMYEPEVFGQTRTSAFEVVAKR